MASGNVAADLLVHVGADVGDATRGLDSVGRQVDSFGKGFQRAGFVMAGASAAIIGGLGASVISAANFEQALAEVNAVADLTESQMSAVESLAIEIGQATSFSATEGAAAIGELVRAGIPLEDVLNGAAMSASHLAEAGGIGIPEAAQVMSNSMNMFGIAGTDAARVADTFAAAANASAADVSGLAAALNQGGPAAAAMGMSLEDTTAALALFANYGIQGSDAGTSLKTMLMRLAAPTDEAAALMGQLGIAAFDANGNFVGMESLAGQLQTALAGMTQEQQQAALATIFGADAMRVANILFQEGAAGVAEMNDAVRDQGAAGRMAAKRMDSLNGAIEMLKGSLETAMIVIGGAFIPAIRGIAEGITGILDGFLNLPVPLQKFVGLTAAAAAGALALGAGISLVIGFLGPAAAGLAAILSPIGLLIAAVVGLYVAWQTNFLGIRDIVAAVVEPILSFFGQLINYFKEVHDGSRVMTESLKAFPEPLQGIIAVLGAVVDGFTEFIRIIGSGGSLSAAWREAIDTFNTQPIKDKLAGLPGDLLSLIGMIPWGDIGNAIWNGLVLAASYVADITPDIVSNLGDLTAAVGTWVWEKASAVDWAGLLKSAAGAAGDITADIVSGLGDLTVAIGGWLTEKASAVDWAGLLKAAAGAAGDITADIVAGLGDLTGALTTWVTDKATAVDWAGLLKTAAGAVGDITGDIVSKLGDLTGSLNTWVSTSATAVGWKENIGAATDSVAGIAAEIPGKLGDLAMELKNWYDNAINSVDWHNMGFTIGEKVGDITSALAEKATQLVTGFKTAVENADWAAIATAIGALILGLPATIAYVGATMGPKALEFMGGFLEGLTGAKWSEITTWLADLPNKALAAVPGLAEQLLVKGQELISGILTGLTTYWPDVSSWLGQLGTHALDSIPGLTSAITSKATELMSGFLTQLRDVDWVQVATWLGTVAPLAANAMVNLATALAPKATELMQGFLNQMRDVDWVGVAEWLGTISTLALEAVGDLSEAILSRGVELIAGLAQGAADRWPGFETDLKAILPAAFNLLADAATKLVPRGVEVIAGLARGAANRWPGFQADILAILPAVFNMMADAANTLYERGVQLLQGLRDGMASMWHAVSADVANIGPALASIAAGWVNSLYQAGLDVMSGLKDGLAAGWEEVKGYLSSLNPADWKGPEKRDREFLYKPGMWIMEGLSKGLDKGWDSVTEQLQGYVPELRSNVFMDFGSDFTDYNQRQSRSALETVQGRGNVTQYIQIDAHFDDVEDMVRAAKFVKEVNQTRQLYGEVA